MVEHSLEASLTAQKVCQHLLLVRSDFDCFCGDTPLGEQLGPPGMVGVEKPGLMHLQ